MNALQPIHRWFFGFAMVLGGVALASPVSSAQSPAAKKPHPPVAVIVVDRSGSRAFFPDHDRALLQHLLGLARLGEDLAMAVVFYSDDVRVVGVNGAPTLAVESLRTQLLKNFPPPKGPTPMVEAFEKVLAMVKALPVGTDVTMLHLSDGEPESGRLQPEHFPDVKAALDKIKADVQSKYRDFPPATIQKKLSEAYEDLGDPTKDLAKPIWTLQRQGEFGKAKKLLETLKAAKVRIVSVDYVGLAALKALHDSGSNRPGDYLLATPAPRIFPLLHESKLIRLPRVVVLPPVSSAADPTAFEKSLIVPGDTLCDKMLLTLVFDSPIPDFDANAILKIRVGARELSLTTANDDLSAVLSRDGAGKVDAVHVLLDEVPADGVRLTYQSPKATVSWPGATIYTHLRLSDGARLVLRPRHLKPEATAPFGLAVNYAAEWSLAAFAKGQATAHPLAAAEVVFRSSATGMETLVPCTADPDVKGTFLSDKKELAAGWHDAEVHLTLSSGARVTLIIPKHVQVSEASAPLTIDFPLPPIENGSRSRSHPHLGELGDERTEAKMELTIRTPFDYPLPVKIETGGFVDARDFALASAGATVRPNAFTLQPGKPQKILLTLTLPESLEPSVVDGPIRGRLIVTRTDRNEAVALERFNPPSGYDPAIAADTIGFDLKRPRLTVGTQRFLIGDEVFTKDGATKLRVRTDVAQPYARTIRLEIRHDSQVERVATVRPLGPFRDRDGREVPSARFVAVDGREGVHISPGGTATVEWLLQVDDDPRLDRATTEIEVSAPGMQSQLLTIELLARRPLWGWRIRAGLVSLFALFVIRAGLASIRKYRAGRFLPGRCINVTTGRPLTGILRLDVTPRGEISVRTDGAVLVGQGSNAKLRPVQPDRELPVVADHGNDLVVAERTEDGSDGWRILAAELHAEPACLTVEVLDAPEQVQAFERARRQFRRRLLLAGIAGLAAAFFYTPRVITGAQWVCDLIIA